MIRLPAEFLSIFKYMVNKIGKLVRVGIRRFDSLLGDHERHGFIGNREEKAMKSLDLVIVLPIDYSQSDYSIVEPLRLTHMAQSVFSHQF